MKKTFGILFIFFVGALLGYLYSSSRDTNTRERLDEASDSDHNNKQSQQETATQVDTGKAAQPLPMARASDKKTVEGLPKAPLLSPDPKPEIVVSIPSQNKNEKKKQESVINDSYTVTVPGLTGFVKLATSPPKQLTYRMTPECRKESGDVEMPVETIVVNADKALANVFVTIKEGLNPKATYSVPMQPVVLNQSGCVYSPHVLAVQVGQPFQMINSDPFLHNVNGLAKLNPKFNNGMPTKGSVVEKKFTKAEDAVRIKCDVHPWMNAYLWVVDHPYFSITDTNGKFNIPNLPYGDYVVQIQHERLGMREKKITWGPETKPLEFQF